jgi:putative two-component system response regulator
MRKILIVEESAIVRGVFAQLLDESAIFSYDLAASYEEAKQLLSKNRYDYSVVEHILSDAPKGQIIALLNKHEIAPLVFTKEIDEEFFESFEGANIIDYMIKQKYNNVTLVIEKLKQIEKNRDIELLVCSRSPLFSRYLTQNLHLHGFHVFVSKSADELYEILQKREKISLLILDESDSSVDSLTVVENIRKVKSSKEIKILALSSQTNTYAISSLLNNGVDDYLIKPFSRTEFYVRVYQNIN